MCSLVRMVTDHGGRREGSRDAKRPRTCAHPTLSFGAFVSRPSKPRPPPPFSRPQCWPSAPSGRRPGVCDVKARCARVWSCALVWVLGGISVACGPCALPPAPSVLLPPHVDTTLLAAVSWRGGLGSGRRKESAVQRFFLPVVAQTARRRRKKQNTNAHDAGPLHTTGDPSSPAV